METDHSVNKIFYNRPQLRAILLGGREMYLVWGRGTGKSKGVLSHVSKRNMEMMPRSLGFIVAATYQQALLRTLPSLTSGWEMLGWIEGIHYVINKRHPRWPVSYECPKSFKNCIHCYNGSVVMIISQDVVGSANGLNTDWGIGDEAKLLSYPKYLDEVSPTIRGNRDKFGHLWFHHSVVFTTSMPTKAEGKWILDKEKDMDADTLKLIEALVSNLLILRCEALLPGPNYKKEALLKQMAALEQEINELRRGFVYFSEASSLENADILGEEYFRRERRNMPDFIFDTEIMNIRPDGVEGGFYPLLNTDLHCYVDNNNEYLESIAHSITADTVRTCLMDGDCEPSEPLRMAADWGGSISCITLGQRLGREYRMINNFYALHPGRMEDLAKQFIDYYEPHECREIQYIQDMRWGNSKVPNSNETFNEMWVRLLRDAGWEVYVVDTQITVTHAELYMHWQRVLAETDPNLPYFRFNKENCNELTTSMKLAPIKEADGRPLKKDKKSERNKSVSQEHATHFSDSMDLHLLSVGEELLISNSSFIGPTIVHH